MIPNTTKRFNYLIRGLTALLTALLIALFGYASTASATTDRHIELGLTVPEQKTDPSDPPDPPDPPDPTAPPGPKDPGDRPGSDDGNIVEDAQFRWEINVEANSGAFFGGCNFIMAGQAADVGGAKVWQSASEGNYRTSAGNVRVERPGDDGWFEPEWADRCKDHTGRSVGTNAQETGTQTHVVIDGGTGTYDLDANTAEIAWDGTFSVVFYGGMTYWWATDPVLEVNADGTGQITADLSGYGADMNDLSKWDQLDVYHDVPIANLSGVELDSDRGFVHKPDYEDVKINVQADGVSEPQKRDGNSWGAFPQEFIDFHTATGQAGYWYTTGGLRDPAKPPSEVAVSFNAADQIADPPAAQSFQEPDLDALGGGLGGGIPPELTTQPSPGAIGGLAGITPAIAGAAEYEPLDISALLDAMAADSSTPITGALANEAPTHHRPTAADLAIDWLGNLASGIGDLLTGEREAFYYGLAGLLALGGGAFWAFKKGWLILPWKKY
ncbi:MAG: hypothetical protein ACTH1B_02345 [Yaniella sp.]|uniref:hypothetical protein n=1 Tax=Yaniella sp. TaxID=2773929 RepID=UPI003F987B3F